MVPWAYPVKGAEPTRTNLLGVLVRTFRTVTIAVVMALVGAFASIGPAHAATQGTGTSTAGTTVLQLDLGSLLSARVLGDDSRSTIDSAILNVPEAATVLRPLTLASGAVPALNKEVAPTEVRSSGAEKKSSAGVDLASLGLPQVISGQLTAADLLAIVDTVGARSTLTNGNLANLVLGGGLATVDSVQSSLGTAAAKDASTGARGLAVDNITVLNLGALLDGLGLPVSGLSIGMVQNLVDSLGLLGTGTDVEDLFTTLGLGAVPVDAAGLGSAITTLQSTLSNATSDLGALDAAFPGAACTALAPIPDPLATLIGVAVGTFCSVARTGLVSAQGASAGDLGGLLGGLMQILDGTNLLSLAGVDAGVSSKATDDVSTSVAKVTAAIGDLSIGNLSVPGVDLLAGATAVTDLASSAVGQIDSVLGTIDPDLAGLINLKLLDTSGTGVSKTATGYVKSVANLTAVDLTLTPPANLTDIINGLPATSIADTLLAVPGVSALPVLSNTAATQALETVLAGGGSPVQALVGGARLRIASINGVADFLPATAPGSSTPGAPGDLARTGTNTTALMALAMLLGMTAIGIRRRVLAPVRKD
jgi:hypothetical protein